MKYLILLRKHQKGLFKTNFLFYNKISSSQNLQRNPKDPIIDLVLILRQRIQELIPEDISISLNPRPTEQQNAPKKGKKFQFQIY